MAKFKKGEEVKEGRGEKGASSKKKNPSKAEKIYDHPRSKQPKQEAPAQDNDVMGDDVPAKENKNPKGHVKDSSSNYKGAGQSK